MVWKDAESVFQRRFSWTSLLSDRKLPNYFREWPNGCLHYTKVWHKTYPICDPPHIGAEQILTVPEITPPQSSSCINKVLSSLISVAMQNRSAMVWTQPQICWFRFKSMLISKTNLFECLCIYRKSTIDTTKNMVIQGAKVWLSAEKSSTLFSILLNLSAFVMVYPLDRTCKLKVHNLSSNPTNCQKSLWNPAW